MQIQIIDRNTKELFQEKVYGARWISVFYENFLLRVIVKNYWIQKIVSKVYGFLQKQSFSKNKVEPFVKAFKISMNKFVTPAGGFKSFDDFFIRELKEEYRLFPPKQNSLGSPCEARLSVFEIKQSLAPLAVKGKQLSLKELVGDSVKMNNFEGGHVWVFRLCPVDYHRFHFPDEGVLRSLSQLPGRLHSVNPISLEKIPNVFLENERQLSSLETKNFSEIIYLEVGAICVGEIEQFKKVGESFARGEPKGAFHFGGSTVIMLTTSGVIPSGDLIENTNKGFETLVRVGEEIAAKD
ncbi:phosphatidylserine decarboxylase [bacterium]|nr:phosphatidylserine decarboxylase [bacterium]